LILWDVDHTLIETRGVGLAIYRRAFPAATGRPLEELAKVSGRTELDIMRETLRINAVEPTEKVVSMLAAALIRGYAEARDELAGTGRALPGAADTLATLADNPAIFQTVLTGNLREVAGIKLEVFGLDQYLDLRTGAYSDDHAERAELVAIAQERAGRRAGVEFGNEATILIGDTPNDVAAGLHAGVRVLAVASGTTTAGRLIDCGATWVADELAGAKVLVERLVAQSSI